MLEVIISFFKFNSQEITTRFFDFFVKPFTHREMLWMIVPIVLTIFAMEVYFSQHKKEQTGWNTATANSLVLIFISIDLFRFIATRNTGSIISNAYRIKAVLLVLLITLFGVTMFILNFGHKWPKFLAFNISSALSINLIAYISVVLIYAAVPLNSSTLVASIAFFTMISLLFFVFRVFFPSKEKYHKIP